MLVAICVVVAGAIIGIFIPLWLAITLTALSIIPAVFIFMLARTGSLHHGFLTYPMITLWILLFVPMWIAYFVR